MQAVHSTCRRHEVARRLMQQTGLPVRAATENDSLSKEPQSGSSPVADRSGAAVGSGHHAVIAVTIGDAHGSGALRVARALVTRFGSEALNLPATTFPSAVGRQADSRGRAIVVLPSPDAASGERRTYADRACRVAVSTRHPVLLVPEAAVWPPRRCVAAVDFGQSSIAAAMAAVELLEAPAELVLVFVHQGDDEAREADSVPRHVRLLLEALTHTFVAPAGVAATSIVLTGARIPALLQFTRRNGADLFSLGRQGRSSSVGIATTPVGPTVRGLLETATCSALILERAVSTVALCGRCRNRGSSVGLPPGGALPVGSRTAHDESAWRPARLGHSDERVVHEGLQFSVILRTMVTEA